MLSNNTNPGGVARSVIRMEDGALWAPARAYDEKSVGCSSAQGVTDAR